MPVQWMRVGVAAMLLGACLAGPAAPDDRWESGNDDDFVTRNMLRHGAPQVAHDLQGFTDRDWYRVRVKANHSYEVRASSGTVGWDVGSTVDVQLDRTDSAGNVLTGGAPGDDDPTGAAGVAPGHTVRWIAAADGTDFLRVSGSPSFPLTANDNYDIELLDTTYSVPRWNNSATQITVFLIRNSSSATVDGSIFFHDAGGALVHTQPFSVARDGLLSLNTSTIGALSGLGGSAAVAHLGGYGSLAGKAVAVEPATGFTFDTPMTPFPR